MNEVEELEQEQRAIAAKLMAIGEKLARQKEEDRNNKLYGVSMELTDVQKEQLFWEWVWGNAEDYMPEVKRFLGNSDIERDFWDELHTKEEVKANNDKDEPDKLNVDTTTNLMSQVIEWGILTAAKKLGKDPYWLHKSPEELRKHLIKNTSERRY